MNQNLSIHDDRITLLEYKSLDMEARSRRNNLLFGGFPEEKGENCLDIISDFLKTHLDISQCPPIPRIHRLGKYKRGHTRPIIAYFLDTRDTETVISSAYKLKDTPYNINRDFPPEIQSARRELWPKYKDLKSRFPDSKINLVYPAKIIQDGKVVKDMFPSWSLIMNRSRIHAPIDKQEYD